MSIERPANRPALKTLAAQTGFTLIEVLVAVVILSGGSQIGVLISAFLFIGLPELLREFSNARMLIFGLAMMVMMEMVSCDSWWRAASEGAEDSGV